MHAPPHHRPTQSEPLLRHLAAPGPGRTTPPTRATHHARTPRTTTHARPGHRATPCPAHRPSTSALQRPARPAHPARPPGPTPPPPLTTTTIAPPHTRQRTCRAPPREGARGERDERDERDERGERDERCERDESGERDERDERDERGERDERDERGKRGERDERGERGERGERDERTRRREGERGRGRGTRGSRPSRSRERGAHARLVLECTKNVEQQCPARRDGDLTSPATCTCSCASP